MLSRRRSIRSAIAAFGVGGAIALCSSTPAFAANEGNYPLSTTYCAATQEIQLKYVNGGWHDEQELNPTWTQPAGCVFQLTDNGQPISTTGGAGSGWWYDGPGHYICAYIYDYLTNPTGYAQGICN